MPENNINSENSLSWIDDSIPVSTRFDDPYYSRADGLSEARHVFIGGNSLEQRWPQMSHCTIAELGFGTGLNFLASVIEWERAAAKNATLEFISFEQFPLTPRDMKTALARWPEIQAYADRLLKTYEEVAFSGGLDATELNLSWSPKCELKIMLGDAQSTLGRTKFVADAWYLDGFAPSKNPELWSKELMADVFQNTGPGGTFATYTAAGWVRRNLIAAGFDVTRLKGHAGKREMLAGSKP